MLSPIVTAWLGYRVMPEAGLPLQIIENLHLSACLSWVFINPNAWFPIVVPLSQRIFLPWENRRRQILTWGYQI